MTYADWLKMVREYESAKQDDDVERMHIARDTLLVTVITYISTSEYDINVPYSLPPKLLLMLAKEFISLTAGDTRYYA